MSEYESTIRAMMAMANADEGDRITSSDLAECEAAVCIIQDLQAENKVMHENMLTVVGASTALKAEVARLKKIEAAARKCRWSVTDKENKAYVDKNRVLDLWEALESDDESE